MAEGEGCGTGSRVCDTDEMDIERVLTNCVGRRRDSIQTFIRLREAGFGGSRAKIFFWRLINIESK